MVTGAGLVGGALAGGALLATAWPLALTGAAVGAAVGAAAGSKVSDELECRTHVAEVIHAALGRDKYEVSASLALLQLRCLVFCRVGAFGGDAMPAAVSTWHHDAGMVPGVATKGALGISLRLPNTKAPIAFVACHLAAHAGHSNMQLRNAQVAQALQAGGGGAGAASLFESHAHVFVLGDLNYRLDADALLAARGATDAAERRAEGSSPVEGGEAWQCVVGAISASKWVDLSAVDELTVQRSEARHPLNEFSEGPLLFAPTYKVQRGGPAAAAAAAARTDRPGQSAAGSAQAVPRYNTKRVPSWTDRCVLGMGRWVTNPCMPHPHLCCDSLTPHFCRWLQRIVVVHPAAQAQHRADQLPAGGGGGHQRPHPADSHLHAAPGQLVVVHIEE